LVSFLQSPVLFPPSKNSFFRRIPYPSQFRSVSTSWSIRFSPLPAPPFSNPSVVSTHSPDYSCFFLLMLIFRPSVLYSRSLIRPFLDLLSPKRKCPPDCSARSLPPLHQSLLPSFRFSLNSPSPYPFSTEMVPFTTFTTPTFSPRLYSFSGFCPLFPPFLRRTLPLGPKLLSVSDLRRSLLV